MLSSIQQSIEQIYQIECPAGVEEFLLEKKECLPFHQRIPWMRHTDEALLIHQDHPHQIEVGLFFDSQLIDWSKTVTWEDFSVPPLDKESSQKLGTLIEGVSHFVYLLWRASREESVTQLELELQAEIDKFVLLSRGLGPHHCEAVFDLLFSSFDFNPDLNAEEKSRYEVAGKLGERYCHYLKKKFLISSFPSDNLALLSEIRSFYRMNQGEKIRWIVS